MVAEPVAALIFTIPDVADQATVEPAGALTVYVVELQSSELPLIVTPPLPVYPVPTPTAYQALVTAISSQELTPYKSLAACIVAVRAAAKFL